jgi:mannose-6-phosphate isomerase-like protein (cupin superfamily)
MYTDLFIRDNCVKENKIWGETKMVWSGNNTEIHQITIKKGGYCSKHKHINKYNLFFIIQGKLMVETWKEIDVIDKNKWSENNMIEKTILLSGESTIVSPRQYHRFTALIPTRAIEVYWTYLEKDDIIREDCGGILKSMNNQHNLKKGII